MSVAVKSEAPLARDDERACADAYVLNPFAKLGFERLHDATSTRIYVVAPVRGRSWKRSAVAAHEQPRLFALLRAMLTADADVEVELPTEDLEALREIGLLVASDDVPDEVRFHAALDACDAGLDDDGDAEDAIVHPSLSFDPPAGVEAAPAPSGAGPMVWLTDARSGVAAPYEAGALEPALRRCVPAAAPPPLAPLARAQLRRAGVLVTRRELARAAAHRTVELTEANRRFADLSHAVVPALVPPALLPELQRYYAALVDEGHVLFGDSQVPRRYVQHNEVVARMFLTALTDTVQAVAGVALKPAYAYFASYREGARLEIHVDRPQCEVSVSLLLEYLPASDGASPWPLWVSRTPDDESTRVAIHQRLGDGILYRGPELYHWRTPLPAGHRSTHLFLHYVRRDFQGSID
ncbi:MAG: hypothetical protein JWN44_4470 [Myxococcales bacterium]|nr:hypothetical protein [Myxococcales bacterium]